MTDMGELYTCPVCGYNGLEEPPYDENGYGAYEICPCCGFQFGLDDDPDKEQGIAEWRRNWVEQGCPWFSKSTRPPDGWKPCGIL